MPDTSRFITSCQKDTGKWVVLDTECNNYPVAIFDNKTNADTYRLELIQARSKY